MDCQVPPPVNPHMLQSYNILCWFFNASYKYSPPPPTSYPPAVQRTKYSQVQQVISSLWTKVKKQQLPPKIRTLNGGGHPGWPPPPPYFCCICGSRGPPCFTVCYTNCTQMATSHQSFIFLISTLLHSTSMAQTNENNLSNLSLK